MKNLLLLAFTLILSCGTGGEPSKAAEQKKSALIVIAPEDFRDDEFSVTYDSLKRHEVKITVASIDTTPATGMFGRVVKPDIALDKSNVDEFDALIIIGGKGCEQLWNNEILHTIVKEFDSQKKLIGAICIAPMVLGRAGILTDKIVTAYPAIRDEIGKCCRTCTDADVEISDNVVTCSRPEASASFAATIITILKQ
ncbi:MAG: DJ-1/PfpI family protein [candidate division WOR-3 bacterium]|nr:MAG: DJ-1/PfpI family protein [candidate division WOR-3 bacterium]